MIHYLTSARLAAPMIRFLRGPGQSLAKRFRMFPYSALLAGGWDSLPRGAWIFTALGRDLGRFDPPSAEREALARLHAFLARRDGPSRVLNHPTRYLRRHSLLSALRERGLNDFASWRVDDEGGPQRYPVILRPEHGSKWAPLPLLGDRAELDRAIAAAPRSKGLIAVEFCDTASPDGLYRKYGAFVVGERIVPRHLFFSRGWQVKQPEVAGPAQVEEELRYVESNPHAAFLRQVSLIAGISYGRIDYGMLDGRPQVWEINVTPAIVNAPGTELPAREAVTRHFVRAFDEALDALDADGDKARAQA